MKKIKDINQLFWRRVINTSQVDGKNFDLFRKTYVLFMLIIMTPSVLKLSGLPLLFFNPPLFSPINILKGYPAYEVMVIMHLINISCLLCLGLGYKVRIVGLIHFVFLVLLLNIQYSLVKIDHTALTYTIPLCFSLVAWRSYNSLAKSERPWLPLPAESIFALLIAFGMFTAGFPKAVHWIDFDISRSGFMQWYNRAHLSYGREQLFYGFIPSLPRIVIESIDYLAVIFEIAPLLIILTGRKLYWKIWLVLACIFHMMNAAILNITFIHQPIVYFIFLIPRLGLNLNSQKLNKVYIVLLSVLFAVQFYFILILGQDQMLINKFSELFGGRIYLAFFLWLCMFVMALFSLLQDIKKPSDQKLSTSE